MQATKGGDIELLDGSVGENPLYAAGSATRRQSALVTPVHGDESSSLGAAPRRISVMNVAPRKAGDVPTPATFKESSGENSIVVENEDSSRPKEPEPIQVKIVRHVAPPPPPPPASGSAPVTDEGVSAKPQFASLAVAPPTAGRRGGSVLISRPPPPPPPPVPQASQADEDL